MNDNPYRSPSEVSESRDRVVSQTPVWLKASLLAAVSYGSVVLIACMAWQPVRGLDDGPVFRGAMWLIAPFNSAGSASTGGLAWGFLMHAGLWAAALAWARAKTQALQRAEE